MKSSRSNCLHSKSVFPSCPNSATKLPEYLPFVKGSNRWVTVSTPHVFRDGGRRKWEAFFQRYLGSQYGAGHLLRDYLKYGKSLGYWLEFLFQAYAGHTGNMILVTGVPDNPASLPHSHPKHKL
jgi:hypothetical protein